MSEILVLLSRAKGCFVQEFLISNEQDTPIAKDAMSHVEWKLLKYLHIEVESAQILMLLLRQSQSIPQTGLDHETDIRIRRILLLAASTAAKENHCQDSGISFGRLDEPLKFAIS